jgi:hypothetical protein
VENGELFPRFLKKKNCLSVEMVTMGEERRMRPLLLNWMAGTLEEAIHLANSTGRPELRFVLTGQKPKPPSSFLPSPMPCSVSLTFLVCTCSLGRALYAARAKLLF